MAGRHKGERIVYGSLESVLGKRTKDDLNMAGNATISDALQNGIAKAKASGHVNVGSGVERETLELDDRTLQRQVEHAEVLNRIHLRNVANNIAVPTDDIIVKQRLRELGEPICYFGEDKGDRRDRLKNLMAAQVVSQETGTGALRNRLADVSAGNVKHLNETGAYQQHVAKKYDKTVQKTFYYPASKELKLARLKIGTYSFERADKRLLDYKRNQVLKLKVGNNALDVHNSIVRLHPVASQIGGTRPISSCSLTSDNLSLVTGSWDGLCKMWNLDTLELQYTMRGHKERVIDVAAFPCDTCSSKDGSTNTVSVASSSVDGTAILWPKHDAATAKFANGENLVEEGGGAQDLTKFVQPLAVLKGHADRLGRLAFHPSGRFLGTTSFDRTWRLWDLETCKELLLQEGHVRETYGISFHPDGSLVCTTSLSSHGRLWDLRSGKCIMPLHGHAKPVVSVDFSPNGFHLATGSMDNTLRIWDIRKMRSIYIIPAHSHLVSSVSFAPVTGEFIVSSGYDGLIKCWSMRNFQLIKSLSGHEKHVMKVVVGKTEKAVYSAGFDRTWKKWLPVDF